MSVEQKVVTVSNTDEAINAELTTQNADNWTCVSITLSVDNVILLFNRVNILV